MFALFDLQELVAGAQRHVTAVDSRSSTKDVATTAAHERTINVLGAP